MQNNVLLLHKSGFVPLGLCQRAWQFLEILVCYSGWKILHFVAILVCLCFNVIQCRCCHLLASLMLCFHIHQQHFAVYNTKFIEATLDHMTRLPNIFPEHRTRLIQKKVVCGFSANNWRARFLCLNVIFKTTEKSQAILNLFKKLLSFKILKSNGNKNCITQLTASYLKIQRKKLILFTHFKTVFVLPDCKQSRTEPLDYKDFVENTIIFHGLNVLGDSLKDGTDYRKTVWIAQ